MKVPLELSVLGFSQRALGSYREIRCVAAVPAANWTRPLAAPAAPAPGSAAAAVAAADGSGVGVAHCHPQCRHALALLLCEWRSADAFGVAVPP